MSRLAAFVLRLSLQPEHASRYGHDPEGELKAAGLTAAERSLISTGRLDLLAEALRAELATEPAGQSTDHRAAGLCDFLLDLQATKDFASSFARATLSPAERLMVRSSDPSTLADAVAGTLASCHYQGGTTTDEFVKLISRRRPKAAPD